MRPVVPTLALALIIAGCAPTVQEPAATAPTQAEAAPTTTTGLLPTGDAPEGVLGHQ